MALDIDERHLLRLGHGEEALETEKDFSRYGRWCRKGRPSSDSGEGVASGLIQPFSGHGVVSLTPMNLSVSDKSIV